MKCDPNGGFTALPEAPEPSGTPTHWKETRVIGKPMPKVDGYERVSGSAIYPSDVVLPGMLYGAILRCPHPHARLRRLDMKPAENLAGVHAVLSSHSPDAKLDWYYTLTVKNRLFPNLCRYEGEVVAAVAAETPHQAHDALRAIVVDYEVLPHLSDLGRALDPGAVKVYPEGNLAHRQADYERGDVEKGFADADVVLEREYATAGGLHTPLEPHGCVAKWDGSRLTLWESTQGVYQTQRYVAHMLGLPLANLRVIGHYMGGGFGSKLWPGKYTIVAALLAKAAARPVKLFMSREETMICAGNRSEIRMRLKAGVKKDGALTALEFSCLGTCGSYLNFPTHLVDWLVRDLYSCPNVRTTGTTVYVHGDRTRPFRAPGYPQGAWAIEQMMDDLAKALDMDPVELRLRNVPFRSQAHGGKPYTTTGLRRCILDGARVFGWRDARKQPSENGPVRRGVGMAACLMVEGSGKPPATVVVQLFHDGSVTLNSGASDIGTGTKTVMAMAVAEDLDMDPDHVRIEHADTGTTEFATASGGSKTVATETPAIRDAVAELKLQILDLAANEMAHPAEDLILVQGRVRARSNPAKSIDIRKLRDLQERGSLMAIGYRGPNPKRKVVHPFAAHFCEVEVDIRTGQVSILRYLGVHDSGRVMNLLGFNNQVFGGIVMGIGTAITEARRLDHLQTGKLVTRNWLDYKVPTMLDGPVQMDSMSVGVPDVEANSAGVKGLGEIVTVPVAPAIANAIYNAIGFRIMESPIGPAELVSRFADSDGRG